MASPQCDPQLACARMRINYSGRQGVQPTNRPSVFGMPAFENLLGTPIK
jgi:hypothetical protein